MIKRLILHKIATYTSPASMTPLQLNFIYGNNGSGKSSLAKFISGELNSSESSVTWDNGIPVRVLTYDHDFVQSNFGLTNTSINGVFTLGENSVEAQEYIDTQNLELARCSEQIGKHNNSIELLNKQYTDENTNIDDNCWIIQQEYGAEFSDALVGFRGGKRVFRDKCLQEYINFDNEEPLVDIAEIRGLYKVVYTQNQQDYAEYELIDEAKIVQTERNVLLAQCITGSSETPIGKFIEFLGNGDWVKQGLAYSHKAQNICPYCQQGISTSIQQDLESFFDEAYKRECEELHSFYVRYQAVTSDLLMKLKRIIDSAIPLLDYSNLAGELVNIELVIKANIKTIEDKISSPSTLANIDSLEENVKRINLFLREYNNLIRRNKEIIQNRMSERTNCKRMLWRYFAKQLSSKLEQYHKKSAGITRGINSLNNAIESLALQKSDIERNIRQKEATLTSVLPTVNEINGILNRFGYTGFQLAAESSSTYRIVRPDGSSAQRTLSEGERNFIAFLYFYHLVYGSRERTGLSTEKVVVIDDPISSLDSNVLFIISTLIRGVLTDCRDDKNGIKQVFVLTHNIYFHKEITFLGSRECYPTLKTAYWVLRKTDNITEIVRFDKNPIQTTYELLWSELKDPGARSKVTIFNTLRRILEYYFDVIGGINCEACINEFSGQDKIVCRALISCINDGSHFITDDFVMCYESDTIENYLRVFHLIFVKMGQGNHYDMMMNRP